MAAIQNRNGSFRIFFEFQRKQRVFTVARVTEAEARAKADQVDYLLMRLAQGLITLPPAVNIVQFVRQDGKVDLTKGQAPAPAPKLTLGTLRDRYLQTHGNGTLEERTLVGIRLHFRHLAAAPGKRFPIGGLALADLQAYVDRRAKAKGRRGRLAPATIRKEIVTLRTTWNWGGRMGLVAGRFPNAGLRYPKSDARPPFQTRTEIERQAPGLPAKEQAELWDALYLRVPEVEALLAHVRQQATHRWIYPLLATAAYTGARRSELLHAGGRCRFDWWGAHGPREEALAQRADDPPRAPLARAGHHPCHLDHGSSRRPLAVQPGRRGPGKQEAQRDDRALVGHLPYQLP